MDVNLDGCRSSRRIAIIGGGFSGAVVALNLLGMLPRKAAPADGAHITIIEPRPVLGAGVAYSAPDPTHRVNVSAARLLVLPDRPGEFDAWLRTSGALDDDPDALLPDGRAFPRRAVFGRYLDMRLREAAAAPDAAPLTHVQARATRVERHGEVYEILLDSGGAISADVVVLAVSHPPPAMPRGIRHLRDEPKFFADPWSAAVGRDTAPGDRVLIIGTALSTADAIATLHAAGHTGEVVAVSRRGLVSRQRVVTQTESFGDFRTSPNHTALALLRQARATIQAAEAGRSCWESVIETIREQGKEIWAALPVAERARFLRHVRPYWDVHRYQLAPQLGAIMARQIAAGRLTIQAARIERAERESGRFRVWLRRRGAAAAQEEWFDTIINCTGPDHSQVLNTNAALASLAEAGLVRADCHGLGIDTDTRARALDRDGAPNETLFVSGPLARAAFGELMGLPQVTMHAALVAAEVAELAGVLVPA